MTDRTLQTDDMLHADGETRSAADDTSLDAAMPSADAARAVYGHLCAREVLDYLR